MSKLNEISDWLQENLPRLVAEHDVPGAVAAVIAGGEVVEAAAGVLNKNTGVETTTDSLFQVGSITKVWTATLVMQLADEGLLDIDAPVRDYLPEFRIADEDAAARITVRQLLNHTAGFEGDLFTDTGRGDDCVEKYVATLHDTPQLFAPGEMFSYNNAGYVVLGRVVEALRGKPYDRCLHEHLFTPLGLTRAATSADEAIMFRAAVGHLTPDEDAGPQVAPVWSLVRSNAPAGSMLAMSARDLLAFARMHMEDGAGVLSPASARAMRETQVRVPDLALMGDAWGLGWELFHYPQGTVIGHDGGTIGQNAFLRLVPERGVAVALLTNGGKTIDLYQAVFRHVLRELTGVELPAMPQPAAEPDRVDGERFTGVYVSSVAERVVTQDEDGRIWMELVPKGIMAEVSPESAGRTELVPWRDNTLVAAEPVHGVHLPHAFVGDDGHGRALYLHTGRADRRVAR
ncbi:CubicO group peptidase, beta-lactamase class C family [Lentzea xinjiangensis]|uniref:CubicO group peptidase, beta-lactamase class C family n=1 Tax=Lentzea xinjiangensis TaxID=402600 RepID=A0A1H9VXA0_9PSEU|nr:serine hydrolase domain-containing protein [Lentzea xinjiangensis]SES25987.1 CubicO group peptidase, beta-lactamase class C family [Lentzea xinjiangensis]